MGRMKDIYCILSQYNVGDKIYISDICNKCNIDYSNCLYLLTKLEKLNYIHMEYEYICPVCKILNIFKVYGDICCSSDSTHTIRLNNVKVYYVVDKNIKNIINEELYNESC